MSNWIVFYRWNRVSRRKWVREREKEREREGEREREREREKERKSEREREKAKQERAEHKAYTCPQTFSFLYLLLLHRFFQCACSCRCSTTRCKTVGLCIFHNVFVLPFLIHFSQIRSHDVTFCQDSWDNVFKRNFVYPIKCCFPLLNWKEDFKKNT